MTSRRELLALAAVTALALALRLHRLDAWSFGMDELVQSADYGEPSLLETVHHAAQSHQSPLDYAVGHVLIRVLPPTDFVLRLPAAVYGTLLVPAAWLLVRTFARPPAGLVAGLYVAVCPVVVQFSQIVRPYAILHLLFALFWPALAWAIGTNSRRAWAAFATVAVLHLYARPDVPAETLVAGDAAALLVWLAGRRTQSPFVRTRAVLTAIGVSAACFVAVLPSWFLLFDAGRAHRSEGVLADASSVSDRLRQIRWRDEVATPLAGHLGPGAALYVGLAAVGAGAAMRSPSGRFLLLGLLLTLLLHVVLFRLVARDRLAFVPRYLVVYVTPLLAFAGAGLTTLLRHLPARPVVAPLVALASAVPLGWGLPAYYTEPWQTDDWRAVGTWLDERLGPADLVVLETQSPFGDYESWLQGRGRYWRRPLDVVRMSGLPRRIESARGEGSVYVVVHLTRSASLPGAEGVTVLRFHDMSIVHPTRSTGRRIEDLEFLAGYFAHALEGSERVDPCLVLARLHAETGRTAEARRWTAEALRLVPEERRAAFDHAAEGLPVPASRADD